MAATSALFKGPRPGQNRVKHHLLTDPSGIPLAATLTAANRNDVTQLLPLVDGLGPVNGKPGRPRQRADELLADRGYDHDKYRRELWRRGVKPTIARRQAGHGSGLGRRRWVVGSGPSPGCTTSAGSELATNVSPRSTSPFMSLACAVICQRYLRAL